jgi:glycosyltransferase involved in cell wall biosynthesis
MYELRNKTVYILSPESWGTMKISKHHYAMELADRNCRVFFIEPPNLRNKGISIRPCKDHPLISLVSYKPVFRGKRMLPAAIYSMLLWLQIKLLCRRIGMAPDLVLCFHGYLFEDLSRFGAPVNIYFAADLFNYDHLPPEVRNATFSMAVSDTIYERIAESGRPVHRIKHGVPKIFANSAERLLQERKPHRPTGRIIAGYAGNLRMEAMDRETIMKVIDENPDVKFVFWGSYKSNELNLGGLQTEETDAFIRFLEKSPNVELRGVLDTERLQREMSSADLFWLCLKLGSRRMWDGSNSHKILEYLSTGRPVVAHQVSSYRDSGLLYMMPTIENTEYPALFKKVVELVKTGEDEAIIEKRLQEVVSNAYSKHLSRIENIIRETIK